MCNFGTDGLIANPNAPRPTQAASGYDAYVAVPQVTCGSLTGKNREFFNINHPPGTNPTGAAPGVTVNLACHHVVGWDVIWGFWNALISKSDFKMAREYLAVYDIAMSATTKLESTIKAGTFAAGANWDAKLCWNPLNIVRGPEDRSDDPNANIGLRNKIDFKTAPADAYKDRVAALVQTGTAMCDYIADGTKTKAEQAIGYFKKIRAEKIMEWDETLWTVDKHYPKYSSTPSPAGGFVVVRPTWRINTRSK